MVASTSFDLTLVGQIVIGAMITVFGASLIGIYNYFRGRLHCIDVVNDRTERQSKAILLIAQKLDNKFQNSHSSPENTNFAEEVETALKDNHGNL